MNAPFTVHDGARFLVRAYPSREALVFADRAARLSRVYRDDEACALATLLGRLVAARADLDATLTRAWSRAFDPVDREAELWKLKQRMYRAETGTEHAQICLEAARLFRDEVPQ